MPCDIGYKTVARVRVPAPMPQDFKEEAKAPEIDRDLLEKLGEDDPEFAEWVQGLDVAPLLAEALKRALLKVPSAGILNASIKKGNLVTRGRFTTNAQRRQLEAAASLLSQQFQMEVVQVVAQILDYATVMNSEKNGAEDILALEGEKETGQGVNRYLKVTRKAAGDGVFAFEHFDSKKSLISEEQKFTALAQKLGVKLVLRDAETRGQPIAVGTVHDHFLREK